jgi:hypothetical protein
LDARTTTFTPDADFSTLSSILPRFEGEIPYGSLALVGYVVSMWGGTDSTPPDKLSLSLNWVVVLATPVKAVASSSGSSKTTPIKARLTQPIASGSGTKSSTPVKPKCTGCK